MNRASATPDKRFREVFPLDHHGRHFVCVLDARPLMCGFFAYRLYPVNEYFEAIALDLSSLKYFWFKDHFFQRYAERMGITHWEPIEILLHFNQCNPKMVFEASFDKLIYKEFKGMIQSGVLYCDMFDNPNIVNFKTFIGFHTLSHVKANDPVMRKLRKKLWCS